MCFTSRSWHSQYTLYLILCSSLYLISWVYNACISTTVYSGQCVKVFFNPWSWFFRPFTYGRLRTCRRIKRSATAKSGLAWEKYDAAYDHGSFLQFRVSRFRTCSGLGSRSRPSLTDKNTCGLDMLGRLGTPLIGSVGLPRFDYWMSLGTWPCSN